MWCFDSWAVLDGFAFVSYRQPETIEATTTVFLSVPDLEPVPIGRISTALRAQKSFFKMAFEALRQVWSLSSKNLEQVKEVIRRGYLGGGMAPAPAPVEPPPSSPFRPEEPITPYPPETGPGGEHFNESLRRLLTETGTPPTFDGLSKIEGRRDLLLDLLDAAEYFYPFLQAYADATLMEFLHAYRRRMHLPELRERLGMMLRLFALSGMRSEEQR